MINKKEIFEKTQKMKWDAEAFLKEKDVLKELEKNNFEFEILGSLYFDLMYDSADIDIKVKSKNIFDNSKKFFNLFVDKKKFQKMEYGNFIDFPRKNRPKGCIVNLRTEFRDKKWEIEIWFVDEENFNQSVLERDEIYKKINSKNKEKILILKDKRLREYKDKNNLSSWEIYKEVLGF